MKGRPGLNPLRFYHVVDRPTLETLKQLAIKLGLCIEQIGKTWLFWSPGIAMAVYRFAESDQPGVTTVVDEDDAEGNLRSIMDARRQADWVLVALHNHEWDPEKDLSMPPKFVTSFARACIDAGADSFIGQGSHSMLRGMEVYRNRPIFYDPGDFLFMSNTVTKLPADFYLRPGYSAEIRNPKATPVEGFDARTALPKPLNPSLGGPGAQRLLVGGPQTGPGCVVALCNFGADRKLTGLKFYPFTLLREPRGQSGIPLLADASTGRKIIEYLAAVSSPFGTKIEFKDGVGLLKL
jgi:poly-gamma-glutamate synthesis protein (capsule biosynthesis protein)